MDDSIKVLTKNNPQFFKISQKSLEYLNRVLKITYTNKKWEDFLANLSLPSPLFFTANLWKIESIHMEVSTSLPHFDSVCGDVGYIKKKKNMVTLLFLLVLRRIFTFCIAFRSRRTMKFTMSFPDRIDARRFDWHQHLRCGCRRLRVDRSCRLLMHVVMRHPF